MSQNFPAEEHHFLKAINDMIDRQVEFWPLAFKNYQGLHQVARRTIEAEGVRMVLQYNPHRILSSNAKVDAESIKERPCFLCQHHLPVEQESVSFNDDFHVLVNPYPIFKKHLTIPSLQHRKQNILSDFGVFLELTRQLSSFVVFYNGPKCGASAPDHMHFQAGNKGFLPIEEDFNLPTWKKLADETNGVKVWMWRGYLRSVVTFESSQEETLAERLVEFYHQFSIVEGDDEPMMNLLGYYTDGHFIIHWFPRKKHRSSHFFKQGDGQILVSPASVDLGGVLVTPREEDFNKITMKDISEIFEEISMADDEVEWHVNQIIS